MTDLNDDIREAVRCMREGGVILYPTDTVWGIGCDATRTDAVKRIFDIKRRAESKALIALVDSRRMLERYVSDVPSVAWDLMDLAERPITVVLPGARGLSPAMTGADGTAGLRLTREAYSSGLCRLLRRPVVSTSANISGMPPAALFREISTQIIESVDYVARYRRDDMTRHRPSAVVSIGDDLTVKILRP